MGSNLRISPDVLIASEADEWLYADRAADLSTMIYEEYANDDLNRLAHAAVAAAVSEVRPKPEYADVISRELALNAVRFALGLKELPDQEGEQ